MRDRCLNANNKRFDLYGARGITICREWADSFDAFVSDMGIRPSGNHSIDRIDNDGPYTPQNCRWATRVEQARNTRATQRVVRSDGLVLPSITAAAEIANVSVSTMKRVLGDGTPVSGYRWTRAERSQISLEETAE